MVAAVPGIKKEMVRISPIWTGYIELEPNQKGYLKLGYSNCSLGLSQDWIAATKQQYSLYKGGELIQEFTGNDAKWDKPFVAGESSMCLHGDGTTWLTFWEFHKLKFRGSGEYLLVLEKNLTAQLTDGYDYAVVDGHPDLYPAETKTFETIIVVLE